MGVGPEPLARDVHLICLPGKAALTVEVVGLMDAVKQAATILPQIIEPISDVQQSTQQEQTARKLGTQWVDHSQAYLQSVIKTQMNMYIYEIAAIPVGYQLEHINRVSALLARSQVKVVFPHEAGDTIKVHQWQIDWDKRSFASSTIDHHPDGSTTAQTLEMSEQKVVSQSDQLAFAADHASDIPWPVTEDQWPVQWMVQQNMLDQWMLIRTAYTASPPVLNWVCLQKAEKGYRVLRRPVQCVDANIFLFDDDGNFESLQGFDNEAGATSTLALRVQRVDAKDVYNQWPTHVKPIEQWTKDHE
jgi:hypothetical protein